MKLRLALILAVLAAALAIAGCAGGGGDSGADPASLAPPNSPVFIEATWPEGEVLANIESLAEQLAGVDDLGDLILSKIEIAAGESGKEFDYGKEVQPWLGKRAGLFLKGYNGDDFSAAGIAIQATDTDAASELIEKRFAEGDEPAEEGSYEGVDYLVDPGEGNVYGVIGDFFAYAEDVQTFKAMVDASDGESLADSDTYSTAVAEVPSDTFAHAFADIGALVRQSGDTIDSETEEALDILGIEPKNATAVVSLIPGSDSIELDLSTDVVQETRPSGDASALLGSMPVDSAAALASPEAGEAFGQAVDRLDREGIPAEGVQPRELKKVMAAAGIKLDSIANSIGDAAVFVEGSNESSLGGAVVLASKNPTEAKNTVASVGLLLRSSGTAGVTTLNGKFSGFSIRDSGIGSKPLVIATTGKRIAVAYGMPSATKALAEGGKTLADYRVYKEAVASLGDTPIKGFADGPAAVRFVSAVLSPSDREGFEDAESYTSRIAFLALGSESTDQLGKAKLVVGIGK